MSYNLKTIIAALMLIAGLAAHGATSASHVLKVAADKVRNMPSLTADVTVSSPSGASAAKLLLSGDKFSLTSAASQSMWYDGTTQWVYNPAVDEINISTPTADELAQVNPFKIISTFQKSYNARLLKAPAGKYIVELTPKDRHSDFTTVVVTLDAKSYMPSKVAIETRSMGSAVIGISNIRQGGRVPASRFTPNKKDYPKAEFIDLR